MIWFNNETLTSTDLFNYAGFDSNGHICTEIAEMTQLELKTGHTNDPVCQN